MKIASYYATELDFGGYGYIGQQYKKWLTRLGVEMLPPDRFGWDLLVAYTPPRATILGRERRDDVVLHTMFEARPMPSTWVEICNRVGLVWVPSYWCRNLFREYGVTTDIIVSGYGYDPDVYQPIDRRGRTTPLKVLIWGDVLVSRKQVMTCIRTFLSAELEHATLEVKLNDRLFSGDGVVDEDGNRYENISFITKPMSQRDLSAWLESGDVLLYLSGGEGYGLQPLEAMATGMPVITMRVTGQQMYLTPGAYLDVPSLGRHQSPSLTAIYKEPMFIHQPDEQVAVQHLRWVAEHRDAAAEVGMQGYESVRALTWEAAAIDAATQLEEHRRMTCNG